MSVHLSRDLDNLHRSLMKMCTIVEELIQDSVNELDKPNSNQAEELAKRDREIDEYDVMVEEECLKILALHQPVAADLRRITAVMKISGELERVADLAVHIAERAGSMGENTPDQVPAQVHEMGKQAITMLHESIDAYVNLDTAMAHKVCKDDDIVDDLNRQIIGSLVQVMKKNPDLVDSSLHLFSASRHIERVADHATNIAEDVIYLVEGEIVRHRGDPNQQAT